MNCVNLDSVFILTIKSSWLKTNLIIRTDTVTFKPLGKFLGRNMKKKVRFVVHLMPHHHIGTDV